MKTSCLTGFLCVCVWGRGGGTKGQGESRSSVAVFSSNQKHSFPLQANLEKNTQYDDNGVLPILGKTIC